MKLLSIIMLIFIPYFGWGQDLFSSRSWVQDATTISFGDPDKRKGIWKHSLNGIRIVFEPQLGIIFQNGLNRFENTNFKSLEKIGLETNLLQGYIALQILLIYPSSVQLDDQSPLRINGIIIDPEGTISVDHGHSIGFSFFDGIIAVGFGGIFFDKRDFQDFGTLDSRIFQKNYVYFNIQPISALKAAIKRGQSLSTKGLSPQE